MASLVEVTQRLVQIQEEQQEAESKTRGKGIQSQLMRQQVKILEVISTQLAILNQNMIEFIENQALAQLKSLDTQDVPAGSSTPQQDTDDVGFTFDGIVKKWNDFKEGLMVFALRFKNFLTVVGLPLVALGALLLTLRESIETFLSTDGTTGEKIATAVVEGLKKLVEYLIAWPSQLAVDLLAWVAGALGFEELQKRLEEVDMIQFWRDLMSGLDLAIEPLGKAIDSAIEWFKSDEAQNIIGGITAAANAVVDFFIEVGKTIADWIYFFQTGELIGNLKQTIDTIKVAWETLSNWFAEQLDALPDWAKDLIGLGGDVPDSPADDGPTQPLRVEQTQRENLAGDLATEEQSRIMNSQSGPVLINTPTTTNIQSSSSSTSITGGSGPVRDPDALKMGRGG